MFWKLIRGGPQISKLIPGGLKILQVGSYQTKTQSLQKTL